jgi:hypothetical protein
MKRLTALFFVVAVLVPASAAAVIKFPGGVKEYHAPSVSHVYIAGPHEGGQI